MKIKSIRIINNYKMIALFLSFAIFVPSILVAAGFIPSDAAIAKDGFGAFAMMINTIINWIIGISIYVAALTFSIAGAQILLNPENPAKRQEAMDMFKKTAIGMLLVLGAWLIVHTVVTDLVKPSTNALRFFSK